MQSLAKKTNLSIFVYILSQIFPYFVCQKVLEFIREGRSVAELMDLGRHFLGRQVMIIFSLLTYISKMKLLFMLFLFSVTHVFWTSTNA